MSTVFEDKTIVGAATHVLVVGIGAYPHLIGGKGELARFPASMRQLTSPPASAKAFADWTIGKYDGPERPLASVELLLCGEAQPFHPPPRDGLALPESQAGRATLADIIAATERWKRRATHPNDLMIFYFCGHGISKGGTFGIVAEDYGSDQLRPRHGLIDVQKFLIGMQDCAAREQCYFIDACRASDETLVEEVNYGHELVQKAGPATQALAQCVYYSTLGGALAYGREQQPSVYTQALLLSLAGAGAANSNGEWRVNSTRLFEAISHIMKEMADPSMPRVQVPISGSQVTFNLHRIDGAPELPFLLGIDAHQGDDPPTSVTSLTFQQGKAIVASYPPADPPHARRCEWRDRYFETWLRSGVTKLGLKKEGADLRLEEVYLVPPGLALKGW